MQIANRLTAAASGDGLNNLAGRNAGQTNSAGKDEQAAQALAATFFDPTPRISLSADALLYLGQTKKGYDGQPALPTERGIRDVGRPQPGQAKGWPSAATRRGHRPGDDRGMPTAGG